MLYASTRASLIKSLGSSHFPNSFFATSLADLTPAAYTAHLARLAESPPLSPAEKEMAAAEREAGSVFDFSMTPSNNITGVGLQWSDDVEHAVVQLGEGVGGRLVVMVRPPLILRINDIPSLFFQRKLTPCKKNWN
jgi:twinfilin-like protein